MWVEGGGGFRVQVRKVGCQAASRPTTDDCIIVVMLISVLLWSC